LRNPHYSHLMSHPDDVLIVPAATSSPLDRLDGYQYPEGNIISVISTIKQQITNEVIGFIVIDLDDTFVRNFLEHSTFGKTGNFFVTDAEGHPIYRPSETIHSIDFLRSYGRLSSMKDTIITDSINNEGQQFITYTTSQETGWKIIGIAPLAEIVEDA